MPHSFVSKQTFVSKWVAFEKWGSFGMGSFPRFLIDTRVNTVKQITFHQRNDLVFRVCDASLIRGLYWGSLWMTRFGHLQHDLPNRDPLTVSEACSRASPQKDTTAATNSGSSLSSCVAYFSAAAQCVLDTALATTLGEADEARSWA